MAWEKTGMVIKIEDTSPLLLPPPALPSPTSMIGPMVSMDPGLGLCLSPNNIGMVPPPMGSPGAWIISSPLPGVPALSPPQ